MSASVSIGAIGTIVFDPFNDRWKGFIPNVHTSPQSLTDFLKHVALSHEGGTRLTVRTLIGTDCKSEMLTEPIWWNSSQLDFEAFVPVLHPIVRGIAYYGACASERLPPQMIRNAELDIHQGITTAIPKTIPNGHHHIEWLIDSPDKDIQRLVELYTICYTSYLAPFSHEGVRDMVQGSRVKVVRVDGNIVCVCVAEIATIPVQGSDMQLQLVEISDAATHPNFRNQGMYKSIKLRMIQALRSENPHAVITTDPRANCAAIIASNIHLGMHRAGYLPAHCVISSTQREVEQTSRFGNLAVYYVP